MLQNKRPKLVVLSGAGISAESGFSTFRDKEGLWQKYDMQEVCTPEGFAKKPNYVNDFYNRLRTQLFEASPNNAHKLLAEMERDYDVSIITQNVDDLHERGGSTRVVHLHGSLLLATSSRNPNEADSLESLSPTRPAILPDERAKDGSLLRPFIVFFGEAVPRLEEAAAIVAQADIFAIVGTSLNVYPAAGLVRYAPVSAKIFLIDPQEVSLPRNRKVEVLREKASTGVKKMWDILKEDKKSY